MPCSDLDGKGGDDEAPEGEVVLVRVGADELEVGFRRIAFSKFIVLYIPFFPIRSIVPPVCLQLMEPISLSRPLTMSMTGIKHRNMAI